MLPRTKGPMQRCLLLSFVACTALTACRGGGGSGMCSPGEAGCPCTALGACDDGLDCVSNTCVEPAERELAINAADARACEMVLRDGESRVTSVGFDDALQGTHIRRGARTAVTFIARDDSPIAGGVTLRTVRSEGSGASTGEVSELSIEESRCFDRDGEEIPGSSITL